MAVLAAAAWPPPAPAGDWPMWRHDANRSNASPDGLPTTLHLQWVHAYPPLEPAWEDPVNQDRMPFDRLYEPVVVGSTLLFGSNRNDRLTALDTRSGREIWRFYADGPIRFPPVADRQRVCFTGDDGFLYCLDVATGRMIWRLRGGPDGRKVLGNGRLVSAWPARGGPVLRDGVVYFGAGIWPLMGTFVQAVDIPSGEVLWSNERLGAAYIDQPHNAPSFAGLAPQGALAATEDRLLVPGGRSVPACLDRRTGRLLYYHLAGSPGANRKLEGGSQVAAVGDYFINHRGLNTALYELATGKMVVMWPGTVHPVLTERACYLSGNPVVAYALPPTPPVEAPQPSPKSPKAKTPARAVDEEDEEAVMPREPQSLAGGGPGILGGEVADSPRATRDTRRPEGAWFAQPRATPWGVVPDVIACSGQRPNPSPEPLARGAKRTVAPTLAQGVALGWASDWAFGPRGGTATAVKIRVVSQTITPSTTPSTPAKPSSATPKPAAKQPLRELWRVEVDARGALIRAGSRLYAGGKGTIAALELAPDGPPKIVQTLAVEGTVGRLVAADGRLFAVTDQGRIYAFGPEEVEDGGAGILSGSEVAPAGHPERSEGSRQPGRFFASLRMTPGATAGLSSSVEDSATHASVERAHTEAKHAHASVDMAPVSSEAGKMPAPQGGSAPEAVDEATAALAATMVGSATIDKGCCLVFGVGDKRLVEALARQEAFRVIAVDPDEGRVARLRRRLDDAGLYGTRASVHVGTPSDFQAPPYLAALIVCQDEAPADSLGGAGVSPVRRDAPTQEQDAHATLASSKAKGDGEIIRHVFHSLRPYGGVAWLAAAESGRREAIERAIAAAELPGARVETREGFVLLRREGPLSGAGAWTHQNGNVANTAKSDDRLVRLPLGLLWFGGNRHQDILPRHGHAPPEQVIGGRAFLEGTHSLSARDVYTGVELWKRTFDDLGTRGVYFDKTYNPDPLFTGYNQVHIAGANARGTNVVATAEAVYLIVKSECLALDPASGRTLRTFSLPPVEDAERGPGESASEDEKPLWGYLGVWEDLLVAGAGFVRFSREHAIEPGRWEDFDNTSSRRLVVMNRHTGEVLWSRRSRLAFRHNAIAAGAGKLFVIDSLPEKIRDTLSRRGKAPREKAALVALDLRTGEPVWTAQRDVFGTWLGYSAEHDVLLEGGRLSADMLQGEPSSPLVARRGADGSPLWRAPLTYGGPCMLHGRTVYFGAVRSEGAAADLLTGQPKTRSHPLTGQEMPWNYVRRYGCNAVIASEFLLTFRSGAAGFYDLEHDGGTGNFGGFKSSCTSNLVAADGVLNAPDYTRTCTCAYQNQTSLALVHMPDLEMWTFNQFPSTAGEPARVGRIGVNFGAPGDRREADGTLWLDWPSVGGPSPDVPVQIEPEPNYFYYHSLRFAGAGPAWVAASGLEGGGTITIELVPQAGSADTSGATGCLSASVGNTGRQAARGTRQIEYVGLPAPGESDSASVEPAQPPPTYTVWLHFAEPEAGAAPGERVFDVALQGKIVLQGFDPVTEAGGARRGVVRSFEGVPIERRLVITLTPVSGRPPVLCGLKAVRESP